MQETTELEIAEEKLANAKFMANFLGIPTGSPAYYGFIEEDVRKVSQLKTKSN